MCSTFDLWHDGRSTDDSTCDSTMKIMTCVPPLLVFFGPLALIFLARKWLPRFRNSGAVGVAVGVWFIALLPVCQVVTVVGLGVAVEASRGVQADLSQVRYAGLIRSAAATHGLDPALVAAVVEIESSFDASAVSPVGAMGLMQIMPATAAEWGLLEPFDAAANVDTGTAYLAWLIDRYGSVELGLAAYNAGPGRVDACQCIPNNGQTPGYVADVLAAAARYRLPQIALPYRHDYRLIDNGLHGDGDWPGRDYAAACGTPLYAPISGRVEAVGFDAFTGPHGSANSFVLFANENSQVMLMHGEYLVHQGQAVRAGELIGFEASIGNSTECHTHLAIRVRGELVDPISVLQGD